MKAQTIASTAWNATGLLMLSDLFMSVIHVMSLTTSPRNTWTPLSASWNCYPLALRGFELCQHKIVVIITKPFRATVIGTSIQLSICLLQEQESKNLAPRKHSWTRAPL